MTPDVQKLLQPLPPDAPGGQDPRDTDTYAQMSLEIDKLASLTAETLPNWSRIEQLASDYLEKQSKDYLVASWLSEAWTRRYELSGVAAGLTLIAGITAHYWDTAIPPVKRLRGRRNAISWWTDRVNQLLEKQTDDTITAELSESLVKAAKDLDELLAIKDPDANSMLTLIGHLERIPVEQPPAVEQVPSTDATAHNAPPEPSTGALTDPTSTAQATPNQPPETTAGTAPALPQVPEGKLEIKSLSDLTSLLRPVQDYIARVGPALFDFDHANPLSIQFTRFAARAHISEMPPAENGQTAISPPAVAISDAFERISNSKNAEGQIEFCESRIREYPFWLDLDYHSAKGYRSLGPSGAKMRDTIIDLLLNFLRRMPGIEHYSFSDGTPFARTETIAWIERCRQERSGQGPVDAFGLTRQEANSLLSDGKTQEALGVLQTFISNTRSQRDQFRARLALVELNLEQADQANALSLVQPLTDDCLRLNLDQWEPELANQAWQLSARIAQQLLKSDDPSIPLAVRDRYQKAFDEAIVHLASLDFESAAQFTKAAT
ncbi:MAG TPA: type VI secretion system protein TssA [Orrella sp.]